MSFVDFPHHEISLVIDGQQVKGWESYEIDTTMLEPANHFVVRLPFDRKAWDVCRTDRPVKILIDDTTVMSGLIDERSVPEDGEAIEVVGRSRVGRLVNESMPGVDFTDADLATLITKAASPWFTTVTASNFRNRRVLRGRGKKARASDQALVLHTKKSVGTHIQPGMTRWQVIEDLCAQAGYLAWESGDGTELVVGQPDYNQEIQWRFFMPATGSKRTSESTVLGMGVHESTADRYSRIIVVGSGRGTDANYGAAVSSRYAEVKNNTATPDGDGLDFSAPKRLIKQNPINSIEEAQELANREMSRRDFHRQTLTVRAPGHGQVNAGLFTTLFTYDTLASCEDERTGVKGTYYVVGCTYRSDRKGGEETVLKLIPKGTRLVS